MRREEAIARLKAAEPEMRAFGVSSLSLFGSAARDEMGQDSDIDVYVEPGTSAFYALGNYVGAYRRLQQAFPERDIGYCTREGLSTAVRASVEQDAIRIF